VATTATARERILEVSNVSIRFGGVKALTDVSFHVERGQVFSIIGPNGAGKTSMLNCISGRYRPSSGQLVYMGKSLGRASINDRARLGIGRTFQNLALFAHMSVLDNIMVGRHHLMRNNFVTGMVYWVGGAQREEQEHRRKVEDIIDFLEIQHVRNEPAGTLPYGLRKRVELAMGVVMDISHRVMVLDFGKKISEGTPEEVLANEHVKRAYLGEDDELLREAEADVAEASAGEQRVAEERVPQ
jgi:branched-chain amino acid transport system ATP-binding protein